LNTVRNLYKYTHIWVFTTVTPRVPPITPLPAGPLSDPAPCDADGYPNYHLSQAKQQMLMAFFPLIVCALFKIGYSLLCRQVMMTTCNYKLAQLRCIAQ
jgi:hypothetical protein